MEKRSPTIVLLDDDAEFRALVRPTLAQCGLEAAGMAYRHAGGGQPQMEIDFAEVDDTYAYKELPHLEAIGLARAGEAGTLLEEGAFEPSGSLPVNVSGGSLGGGDLLDA